MPATSRTAAFTRLAHLAGRPDGRRITPLFDADPARAHRFSAAFGDLTLDFSKSAIDDTALDASFQLADSADLDGFRQRLFSGAMVNVTEHRAAMHMARRAPADSGLRAALPNGSFEDAAKLAGGKRGATGERFTHVVNIGIGGSDLGPQVATQALTSGRTDARMQARFLSSVDGHAMVEVVKDLDPARTLVSGAHDSSTTGLIARFRSLRGGEP